MIVARYWGGWSEAEIARALGCRPGTVKSLASRALDRLRGEVKAMTASQEDLEDRLRRVLHEQAGSLQVRPTAWPNSAVSDRSADRAPVWPAGDRRVGEHRVRGGDAVRGLTFGGLAVAFGAAVTVLVAVVAVLWWATIPPRVNLEAMSPRGRVRSVRSSPSSPSFAVHRRLPTATPRLGHERAEVVHNLTRLAATVSAPGAEAVRVYLVVRMLLGGGSGVGGQVWLCSRGGDRTIVSATGRVGVVGNGWAGSLTRPVGVSQANGLDASIVPDGVARVKWVFAEPAPPPRSASSSLCTPPSATTSHSRRSPATKDCSPASLGTTPTAT